VNKISRVSLTALYNMYIQAKNKTEKVGYGTLYRMAGGKKDIPEYSLDMMCYISGVDRLRRADKKYSELLVKENEKARKREEQIAFYLPRYKSILDYITYVFGLKLVEERNHSNTLFIIRYRRFLCRIIYLFA